MSDSSNAIKKIRELFDIGKYDQCLEQIAGLEHQFNTSNEDNTQFKLPIEWNYNFLRNRLASRYKKNKRKRN